MEYLEGLSASLLIPTTSRANCNNTTGWLNDIAERWMLHRLKITYQKLNKNTNKIDQRIREVRYHVSVFICMAIAPFIID